MILAGIDEAGLGPTLGPLITASAALEVPDEWQADTPWKKLAGAVADRLSRKDNRPAVGDSKVIHNAGGMAALELTVGVFSLLANGESGPRLSFPNDDFPGSAHPCYSRALEPFPLCVERSAIAAAAGTVAEALKDAGATAAHLEALALHETCLNRRFHSGLNKNQALLLETGRHLSDLEAKFPGRALLVVVDKQGGRNDYLPFLSALFPGAWLDTLAVGAEESRYRLRRDGGDITMRFRAKADSLSFPTALASMAAKYARERAMRELNAWFGALLPGLKPTAGYPADAARWLAEVKQAGNPGLCMLEMVVRER